MRCGSLCSAQTTVFPRKMLVHALEGVVCSGRVSLHNPKVGSSILPPATNVVNNLQRPTVAAVRHCGENCVGQLFLSAQASPSRVASLHPSRVCSVLTFECIDGPVWP